MFFVKVIDEKIVQTGSFNCDSVIPVPEGFEEVSKEVFEKLTNLPADFERINGKIASVVCPPAPEPVKTENELEQLRQENSSLGQQLFDLQTQLLEKGVI
ncbi:MAG TPA: hypothetical protein VF941_23795 [Clostridia bacterium]